jgi:hypothetical protein
MNNNDNFELLTEIYIKILVGLLIGMLVIVAIH